MHLQPTNNILIDIEAVVNEVGSFFYPFFFTSLVFYLITERGKMTDMEAVVNEVRSFLHSKSSDLEEANNTMMVNELGSFLVPDIGILDLALSDLLPKFEPLKPKIKEHYIRVSNMPTDMAPNTFLQEAGHEDILIRAVDIAYEVEYVINSFSPVWYLTLRLPQLIEKIQLIRMSIQEIKNKLDVAGVPEVPKYRVEHVSSQSKEPPILDDIVVGFNNMEIEIATTC
ncbi:putative late blight resistance protein-like protein R1A-3 [Forsythia ovata]|uniref:Late blight resistance protein-like protein R1A-3 n=1 Tax=Forsythia ovata TaxID=205694 RepID=A0ABD1WP09_9LAMI